MADSGGTAPSMNRCTRLLRHPQAVTNLQVIQVTSSIRAEIQAWLSWPRALPLATEVMGVSSQSFPSCMHQMRIPAYAVTLCNMGDGHLVHIMAYSFSAPRPQSGNPVTWQYRSGRCNNSIMHKRSHTTRSLLFYLSKYASTHVGTSHAIRQWTTILQQLQASSWKITILIAGLALSYRAP